MTDANRLIQDSKALDDYIHRMEARSAAVQREIGGLAQDTARLRAAWQDHQFYEFERAVRDLSTDLDRHNQDLRKTIVDLKDHAERLGTYIKITS